MISFAMVAVFPELVTSPVRFALVVTVPAVSLAAVPVKFVATPLAGVPKAGVTNVGLVANTNAPLPVSSEIVPANSDDDVAAKSLNFAPDAAIPASANVWLIHAEPFHFNNSPEPIDEIVVSFNSVIVSSVATCAST